LISNLTCRGYYSGENDGIFGAGTETGIRNFQRDHSLTVDGIAGTQTRNLLSQQCNLRSSMRVGEFRFEETERNTGCGLFLGHPDEINNVFLYNLFYILGGDSISSSNDGDRTKNSY
jgi:hypothetical protein